MSRRPYRFKGPRAEWKMLDEWAGGSLLEAYDVDPAWLDVTFDNRMRTWRVIGLHKSYRSGRPRGVQAIAIVDQNGVAGTIGTKVLRKIIAKPID